MWSLCPLYLLLLLLLLSIFPPPPLSAVNRAVSLPLPPSTHNTSQKKGNFQEKHSTTPVFMFSLAASVAKWGGEVSSAHSWLKNWNGQNKPGVVEEEKEMKKTLFTGKQLPLPLLPSSLSGKLCVYSPSLLRGGEQESYLFLLSCAISFFYFGSCENGLLHD